MCSRRNPPGGFYHPVAKCVRVEVRLGGFIIPSLKNVCVYNELCNVCRWREFAALDLRTGLILQVIGVCDKTPPRPPGGDRVDLLGLSSLYPSGLHAEGFYHPATQINPLLFAMKIIPLLITMPLKH